MTAKIKLNAASGGGSISIQAPSSSSNNRVISLPDIADGTLLTNQSSLDSTKLSPALSAGITMADQWRLTSTFQGNANPISSNLERVDTTGYGVIGSAMTQSSGIFTFPSTGIYRIDFQLHGWDTGGGTSYLTHNIRTTTNNSSYVNASHASPSAAGITSTNQYMNGYCTYVFDVTDTSTHKVQFKVDMSNTSSYVTGDTNVTFTGFWFTRLGDT